MRFNFYCQKKKYIISSFGYSQLFIYRSGFNYRSGFIGIFVVYTRTFVTVDGNVSLNGSI
jgi:hypothetical protein